MNRANVGVSRRDLALATCAFLGLLALFEGGARWATARIARGEDATFVTKRQVLQRATPAEVLILGDSAAQDGLMPEVVAPGRHSYNAAVPSGSGIVARELRGDTRWQPQQLVYAGVPIEVLDTWELQRHERRLVGLSELAAWQPKSGDLVLAKLSRFFGMREELRASAGKLLRRNKRPLRDSSDSSSGNGFRGRMHRQLDATERQALAKEKAQLWFARTGMSTHVRSAALVEALANWSAASTKRALIVMPISSPLRAFVDASPDVAVLDERWRTVAKASVSSLLDCRAALPDQAFYDDAHLDRDGARSFSKSIGAWLDSGVVPAGCHLR